MQAWNYFGRSIRPPGTRIQADLGDLRRSRAPEMPGGLGRDVPLQSLAAAELAQVGRCAERVPTRQSFGQRRRGERTGVVSWAECGAESRDLCSSTERFTRPA